MDQGQVYRPDNRLPHGRNLDVMRVACLPARRQDRQGEAPVTMRRIRRDEYVLIAWYLMQAAEFECE
jgi:hypothetical protein